MNNVLLKTSLSLALVSWFVVGCSTKDSPQVASAPQASTAPSDAGPGDPTASAGGEGGLGPTWTPPVGSHDASWTPLKDYWFDVQKSDVRGLDLGKAGEVALYLRQHPGQRAGIDGAVDANDAELRDRRVATVRAALVTAGVPSYKIDVGSFADPGLQRDSRVEVLVGHS